VEGKGEKEGGKRRILTLDPGGGKEMSAILFFDRWSRGGERKGKGGKLRGFGGQFRPNYHPGRGENHRSLRSLHAILGGGEGRKKIRIHDPSDALQLRRPSRKTFGEGRGESGSPLITLPRQHSEKKKRGEEGGQDQHAVEGAMLWTFSKSCLKGEGEESSRLVSCVSTAAEGKDKKGGSKDRCFPLLCLFSLGRETRKAGRILLIHAKMAVTCSFNILSDLEPEERGGESCFSTAIPQCTPDYGF